MYMRFKKLLFKKSSFSSRLDATKYNSLHLPKDSDVYIQKKEELN